MSKFCPKHGDPNELPHMVNHCTCQRQPKFPINLLGELVAVRLDSGQQLERILLPDWKRSLSGILLGAGPDVKEAKEGDRVSFGAAVGMDSVLSGEAIRILKEQDLDVVYEA